MYRILLIVLLLPCMNACYYLQAASGQIAVLNAREDIDELLNGDALDEATRTQLEVARDARAFAIEELGLPDNGSYETYADLDRKYVVWNVFAAPEFSLEPHTWCFPVAGCVSYRGHFKEARARKDAEKLQRKGFDILVGGVPAYSTLGKFKDPILSSMLNGQPNDLTATLFHELAHQKLYVAGDSEFNESFATAVADIGLQRWLQDEQQLARYRHRQAQSKQFLQLVAGYREKLKTLYDSGIDETDMRREKERLFTELGADYQQLGRDLGHAGPLRAPVNNAALVPLSAYNDLVPAFMALYEHCSRDLECFYDRSATIAVNESAEARRQALRDNQSAAPGGAAKL